MITQELFNKVYLGLAAQGFVQSINHNTGLCCYRNSDGLKCAIGHLISDDEYDPKFDTKCYGLASFHEIGMLEELTDNEFHALQKAHDCGPDSDTMQENLRKLAQEYDLTIPEIIY